MSEFRHEKLAYTIEEVAELTSLSRTQLYHLIDMHEIATIKVGKSRRVTHAQLDAFVQRLEQRDGFVRIR